MNKESKFSKKIFEYFRSISEKNKSFLDSIRLDFIAKEGISGRHCNFIYNLPSGEKRDGEIEIWNWLKATQEKNRIILCTPGILRPQDIPLAFWYKIKYMQQAFDLMLPVQMRTKLGIMRILEDLKNKARSDGDHPIDPLYYIKNTCREIQASMFNGETCEVLVICNSGKMDFLQALNTWNRKTVLITTGHWSNNCIHFVDGTITAKDLPEQEQPLAGIVFHTCGNKETHFSQDHINAREHHYWNRGTNPIDFLINPLPGSSKPEM